MRHVALETPQQFEQTEQEPWRERIEVIRGRCEAASSGEWLSFDTEDGEWLVAISGGPDKTVNNLYFGDMETNTGRDIANADFIANAREDVPYLLALVETLDRRAAKLATALILIKHQRIGLGVNRDYPALVDHLQRMAQAALKEAQ